MRTDGLKERFLEGYTVVLKRHQHGARDRRERGLHEVIAFACLRGEHVGKALPHIAAARRTSDQGECHTIGCEYIPDETDADAELTPRTIHPGLGRRCRISSPAYVHIRH